MPDVYRIASKCPHFESTRYGGGLEYGVLDTRSITPRCDHCANWLGGSCDLFLAKG